MSIARDRIAEVLAKRSAWPIDQIDVVIDDLMPIVRDAVARGFESAAVALIGIADGTTASELLRQWAKDARETVR